MSGFQHRVASAILALLAVLATTPAHAGPIMEWLCGCSATQTSYSTYTPGYVPTDVVVAPASNCSSCTSQAPQTTYYTPQTTYYAPQTTYYAPQTVYYAPTPVTVYRPAVPRPVTTYYASSNYNPYSAAPVTVYRPIVPVVSANRVLPYTSYRMMLPATTTYYVPTIPYASVSSPCSSCGVPITSAGCSSCGASTVAPTTTEPIPTANQSVEAFPPSLSASSSATGSFGNGTSETRAEPPKTYEQKKPEIAPEGKQPSSTTNSNSSNTNLDTKQPNPSSELKLPKNLFDSKQPSPDSIKGSKLDPIPIPRMDPPVKTNSLPNWEVQENQDRTTMRPIRQVSFESSKPEPTTVRTFGPEVWQSVNDKN